MHATNLQVLKSISLCGTELDVVSKLDYLGSTFTADSSVDKEVSSSTAKARYTWHPLKVRTNGPVWNCLCIPQFSTSAVKVYCLVNNVVWF